MTIFKYELRQIRGYTLWWSVASAFFIFAMLPVYVSMLSAGAAAAASLVDSGIFELLGTDPSVIAQPIGVYGFLTSFFSIASGISGMFLGLKIFTKETVGRSAEYLYTKPFQRGKIFCAKVGAALVSSVVIGICYLLGSVASAAVNLKGIAMRLFVFVGLSFMLIQIFFVLLGALVGVLAPKIRTPLLAASGTAFTFYVFSGFASKMNYDAIKYFTPFSYFGASKIVSAGGYDAGFMAMYAVLAVIFAVCGYIVFCKKDIQFIS